MFILRNLIPGVVTSVYTPREHSVFVLSLTPSLSQGEREQFYPSPGGEGHGVRVIMYGKNELPNALTTDNGNLYMTPGT